MRELKCPFCNKELEPIIGACEDWEYYCKNCDCMTGDENLWNQLTKYKQALNIAVDALKDNLSQANFWQMLDASRFHIIRTKCEYALVQIKQAVGE